MRICVLDDVYDCHAWEAPLEDWRVDPTPFLKEHDWVVVGLTKDALVTAFATGSLFVVLPILAAKAKEMIGRYQLGTDEHESFVDIVLATSYSFPSVGMILNLSFITFAAWFVDLPLGLGDWPRLIVLGPLNLFGSYVNAIIALLDMFRVPADMFQLFMVGNVITG